MEANTPFTILTGLAVVSQDTFPDSQNEKTLYHGCLDAQVANFLTQFFAADTDSVSHSWIGRKRRFQHKHEFLCEKNNAASQAALASDTNFYVRKSGAFAHVSGSDNGLQRLLNSLENLCENRACYSYSLKAPHRPL